MLLGVAAVVGLSLWILTGASAGSVTSLALGLGLAAFLLEVSAPRLGRFGFFSVAAAPLLAIAMIWPTHLAIALLFGLAGLSARSLSRGAAAPRLRGLEFLSDLIPLVITLAVVKRLPFDGGLLGYAAPVALAFTWVTGSSLLSRELPQDLLEEWAAYRSSLWWGGIAAAAAAVVLASLPQASPVAWLGAVGMLAALTPAAPLAVAAVDSRERGLTQREKERSLQEQHRGIQAAEGALAITRQAQQRSAAELETRLSAYTLVEDMLEGISLRPVLNEVAQAVVDRLRRKMHCQTTVLFWIVDDHLVPLAHRTPLAERLQASTLLQFDEPVVTRAHKLRRSERGAAGDRQGETIFPEETYTLAVPMRDRGVLYFGDPRGLDVDDDTMHFLQVLANHAVIALGAAHYYQRLEESLRREADAASRNEALVQRLAQVIDGITEIVHLRDPVKMLERTGVLLEKLVPHHLRLLWWAETPSLGISWPPGDNLVLMEYARTVRHNGRPLLLEKFEEGRFAAPAPGATTLLAVPMVSDSGALGAVVLARQGGGVFTREDQDALSVMVYQLGAALLSAQLYSQLQAAHKSLKETQAQVVQSSKMAAIGQLAGGVAHELNTPLGAIALAIDGALTALHTKPDRAESRLQRASTSVQQMKEIVSKLLFYSRDARSGRRETDLNVVIGDTLKFVGHQLRLDSVEVETDLAPDLPTFVANQNELQQVFTNLCLNARDAVLMPEATARKIHLATACVDGGLQATVRDWGGGMTPQVREKIFDPFYTTKEVGKGTGLGLSVTLQLVQQHGGTISVASAPGQGTTFTLLLPLTPPAEDEDFMPTDECQQA